MTPTTASPASIEAKRQPCQIITRVMGYFRPVSQFNIGKKSEFYGRTYFTEQRSQQSRFMEKYKQGVISN